MPVNAYTVSVNSVTVCSAVKVLATSFFVVSASYPCTVEPISASTTIVESYPCTVEPISASTTIAESYPCTVTPISADFNPIELSSASTLLEINNKSLSVEDDVAGDLGAEDRF